MHIRKSVYIRGRRTSTLLRAELPRIFFLLALGVVAVALADPTRGYSWVENRLSVNRILVGVDNSSSMYNFSAPGPIYCTDEALGDKYPRIYMGCQALRRIIDDTEKFARKKEQQERDQIAILRFALYSKVQAYPTNDYDRLRDIVENMDWMARKDLGIFTEIHLAFWDLFLLALDRNRAKNTELIQLTSADIDALASAVSPGNLLEPLFIPLPLRSKLESLREELRDTVFILITDAHKGQLESRLNKAPFSFKRMAELAAFLELPVYVISTEENNETFKELVQKTGFGEPGGKYRGDFLVVGYGLSSKIGPIEHLVGAILESRFGRKIPVLIERRESYTPLLALVALTLFLLGLISKETISRSLSES